MIIHSPIISGSLTFAQGATFTLPSGGVYSGSFSGSINGIGDPETFSASVDTRIDQLAIDTGSQDGRLDNLEGFTSSIDTTIKNKLNTETVISGSSQVSYPSLSNIPSGIVSGSSQVTSLLPAGVVSGSSQVVYTSLSSIPAGIVSGSEQVVGILSSLNSYTASNDTTNSTQTSRLDQLSTASGSAIGRLSNLELTSASLLGETLNLELYTASNDTKWSTLGALSGSFARTNSSNIFNGNQTITGSLFVSQDLVVAGSSSIQSISSSNLVIGSSYVTLNTFSPSSRFAGLLIVDSGSSGGSGSFLYDSLQDELLFIHRGNGTNTTSSVLLMGPETYDDLGNENYLTNNTIPKATGKEHLNNSNITDTGTLITLGSNTVITGTILASGTALVSGSSQINLGSASGNITLSTQTTGNYVASLVEGTGVTITNNSGEGATPTIAIGQAVATTSEVQFAKVGVGGAHDATYELKVTGDIGATGDIVAYVSSDERLKNNVEVISNPIEKVQAVRGVTWEWNDLASEAAKQSPNLGVIAQEVEAVLPQLVHDRENGFKGVDYAKLTGLLIEAIKEQQKQIDELKSKLV